MKIYESGEDYLEQILMQQEQNGYARSIDVAMSLGYSKASVSIAMKKLRENGYITMDDQSRIRLTEAGLAIAAPIYDRHRQLTRFLVSIGVSETMARRDACKMEHDLSEETYQALLRLTGDTAQG